MTPHGTCWACGLNFTGLEEWENHQHGRRRIHPSAFARQDLPAAFEPAAVKWIEPYASDHDTYPILRSVSNLNLGGVFDE